MRHVGALDVFVLKMSSRGLAGVIGLLLLGAVLAWPGPAARAADVVKPLEAAQDLVRYAYHFELLRAALDKTVERYGPYVEQPVTQPMTSDRQNAEAIRGALINLLISDAGHVEIDRGMLPVPFPIDRGLLGFRVALIDRRNQDRVLGINALDDLRRVAVGQGHNWGDVAIYRYNGVPVETAVTYESLFPMLMSGRFDLFPRGATEAPQELAAFGARYPNLAIDRHLLIRYPFAQFFYVAKSAPRLAERLRDGLEQMLADGSFQVLFDRHFKRALADLNLGGRVVITLQNPFLPDWVPFNRPELWMNERDYRPAGD